jgi:hypothetical protein
MNEGSDKVRDRKPRLPRNRVRPLKIAEPLELVQTHSGTGPLSINHGHGRQRNHAQSGGRNNQQFNADVINYSQYGTSSGESRQAV